MSSDLAFISLSLWVLPVVNLNFASPAPFMHGIVSPAATVEQSKLVFASGKKEKVSPLVSQTSLFLKNCHVQYRAYLTYRRYELQYSSEHQRDIFSSVNLKRLKLS